MIVTFGSLNADLIFEMNKAPQPGQTLLANSFRMEAGGKGANQAVAAARSGAHVVMVGAVGNDALAAIARQNLVDADVDVTRVVKRDSPTGCASIMVDADGKNQIAVSLGANASLSAEQLDDALLAKAAVLLLQMETPPSEVEAALRRAKEHDVFTILNLAPAIKLDLLSLSLCSLLVVNEDEAETAAGWLGCEATATALAQALGTNVLRTMGSEGAEVMSASGYYHVPAHPIVPVDTTAAGDCFIGVLASGLEKRLDMRKSIERATAAAALCCMRKGSQSSLPWADEIDV